MSTSTAARQPKKPLSQRINLRILVFAAIIILPLGWMTYTFIDLQLNAGIEVVEGGYRKVDLKAMGNFPFDEYTGTEENVPEPYRALNGQKVLLIGEMYSDMVASDTTDRFQLVYSIAKCCFGGPPKVQERVFARTPDGKRVYVYPGLAKVYGTLYVRAIRENGKVVSLYDMEVERIEPYS